MEKTYPYSSFESISAVDDDLEAGSAAHSPIPRPRLRRARAGPTRFTADLKFFSDDEDDCGTRRHFLDSCFLCKKPLGVGYGQDIFMYRGDTPFCSEDCRQEQIEIDEAVEKRKLKMATKDKNNPQKIHVRASAGTVVAL